MMTTRTTKGERDELLRFSRRRETVAIEQAKARSAALLADFEQQMAQEYKSDDDRWAAVVAEADAIVEAANEHILAKLRESGIPEAVAPRLSLGWRNRGENLLKERRAELRKAAETRLKAVESAAITVIKAQSVEFEGLVLAGGLESEAARELLAKMPTVDALMPALDASALQEQIPSLPDIAKRYGNNLYALDRGSSS